MIAAIWDSIRKRRNDKRFKDWFAGILPWDQGFWSIQSALSSGSVLQILGLYFSGFNSYLPQASDPVSGPVNEEYPLGGHRHCHPG